MKKLIFLYFILVLIQVNYSFCQTNPLISAYPAGTVLHGNLSYNNDTLKEHLMDIYIPADLKGSLPLVIIIHGGGWLSNDKYADMGYMKNTMAELLTRGFAIASVNYHYSTQKIFPAQVQDCNRAVSFLFDNAKKYGLDNKRFAVMGFSAGGHLASMLGLSKNNNVPDFFMPGTNKSFSIKAVVDFYGPAELLLFPGNEDEKAPESLLIGAAPITRPDLAKAASPVTYIDKTDPPFLIIHGEKDELVSLKQSRLLHSWLDIEGVPNELVVVKGAPHFGAMFDSDEVKNKVISFLVKYLN